MQTNKQGLTILCLTILTSSAATIQAIKTPLRLLNQTKTTFFYPSQPSHKFHESKTNNYRPYCIPKLEETNQDSHQNIQIDKQKLIRDFAKIKLTTPTTTPPSEELGEKIIVLAETGHCEILKKLLDTYLTEIDLYDLYRAKASAKKNEQKQAVKLLEDAINIKSKKPTNSSKKDYINNALINAAALGHKEILTALLKNYIKELDYYTITKAITLVSLISDESKKEAALKVFADFINNTFDDEQILKSGFDFSDFGDLASDIIDAATSMGLSLYAVGAGALIGTGFWLFLKHYLAQKKQKKEDKACEI